MNASLLAMGDNIEDLEQSFHNFVDKDDDACPEEEFEITEVNEEERNTVIEGEGYLRELASSTGLEILKKILLIRSIITEKKKAYFIYSCTNHFWIVYAIMD